LNEKIRVAMLGAGLMARTHLEAIRKLADRAELVAVADVSAEARQRAAAEFDIPQQFDDAVVAARKASADAVIVCIPNHLHAPATLAALESGKHVLVEKPMALSLADAEAMVAAAEMARRVLMCGLSLRFSSPIRQVKALVADGAVGTPRRVVHRRMSRGMGRDEATWFGSQAASGGILPGIGSHSIDAILWWLEDEAARVAAEVRSLNPAMDIEDEAAVLMTTRTGVLASMEFSFNYAVGYDWVVAGDSGVLRLRSSELTLNDQPVAIPGHVPLPGEATLHEEFIAAIAEDRPPAQASGAETLRSIAVIEAAQRAARAGTAVSV
jgi:UDP-N-acetyl-2-amino-2-deoxyglucuronate dehydrogenase